MKPKKILKIWDILELYLAGTVLAVAVGFSFYQVVMRYVFSESPYWAEESVNYLIIWGVFIIASKLARDDEHISADFVMRVMPNKFQRVVKIVCCALALSFCCLLVWYGFKIVAASHGFDERSVGRLAFPMWIAYLAVPAAACLLVLSYVRRLYLLIFQFDPKKLVSERYEE